jgi:hypothetical protein
MAYLTKTIPFAVLLLSFQSLHAQTGPTWANDVAPILYKHCVSCHRAGGIGSFPLETFFDADYHAASILNDVESRYMPPWRALPSYRHFKDENYLTDAEIQTIKTWVNGNHEPGDPGQAPPLPNFQNGSQLSAVDLTLETPAYTVQQATDEYRAFAIPTNVSADKFFNEIEIQPGNTAIIHHVVLYTDPTNEPYLRDQADPGPGFKTNGMVGNITQNATLIGEWTPGGTPIKLPANFGYRIPANGYFIFEIHFAPGHLGQVDPGSVINLKFSTAFNRELYYGVLMYADSTSGLVNPPFKIPANTQKTLVADLPSQFLANGLPMSIFSLTPHAHVVCKSFKAYSYRSGATDTIPLINIPKWDFHWQSTYTLRKPIKINGNRITRAEVTYDNTTDNPNNPNDPPQDVWWGEKTSDEMLYLFATAALYKTGDENIVLDSTLLTPTEQPVVSDAGHINISPNPVQDILDIRSDLTTTGTSDMLISDADGRIVRQWREAHPEHCRISVASLPGGVYFLEIRNGIQREVVKVLKQ